MVWCKYNLQFSQNWQPSSHRRDAENDGHARAGTLSGLHLRYVVHSSAYPDGLPGRRRCRSVAVGQHRGRPLWPPSMSEHQRVERATCFLRDSCVPARLFPFCTRKTKFCAKDQRNPRVYELWTLCSIKNSRNHRNGREVPHNAWKKQTL